MLKISKSDYQRDLEKIKAFLPNYLLNPIEGITKPLILPWQSTALTLLLINVLFGFIHGLYKMDLIQWVISLIITPLMAAGFLLLIALFLSYFFQYMFDQSHEMNHITSVLFWAYIPSSLFFMASLFYPPLYLLGLLVLAVLCVRGLIENFKVPKNTVVTMVVIAFMVALIFWILNEIYGYKPPMKPKSLDQLENEIQN
jgi:hypothetical protein